MAPMAPEQVSPRRCYPLPAPAPSSREPSGWREPADPWCLSKCPPPVTELRARREGGEGATQQDQGN